MSNLPRRAWINQPSSLYPANKFHGMLGLVVHDSGNAARFYPVSGDVVSMRVDWGSISFGWPGHLKQRKEIEP